MPEVPEDSGVLKMEVAGICGTGLKLYAHPPRPAPRDHGARKYRLHRQGRPEFTRRKGFQGRRPGVRRHYVHVRQVRVVPPGPDRHCENNDWRPTPRHPLRLTSAEKAPHLWGGFAHMYTFPGTRSCTTCRRGFNGTGGAGDAMENGVEWSLFDGGVGTTHGAHPGPGPAGAVQNRDLQQPRFVIMSRARQDAGVWNVAKSGATT